MIDYIGNKRFISNFISNYLPNDLNSYNYMEVFGGMMGLYLSSDMRPNKVIYNDYNVYNTKLINNNINKDLYYHCYDNINNTIDIDDDIKWFIIISCSLRDNISNKFYTGSDSLYSNINNINEFIERYKSIDIFENMDYYDAILKYDSNKTFFYLDPPYYKTEDYYINHNFDINSHDKLYDLICKINGKFMLSYKKNDYVINKYNHFNIIEKNMGIFGIELLIMNY